MTCAGTHNNPADREPLLLFHRKVNTLIHGNGFRMYFLVEEVTINWSLFRVQLIAQNTVAGGLESKERILQGVLCLCSNCLFRRFSL